MAKLCTKCHKWKSQEAFANDRTRSDGLNVWCRECKKANTRDYYLKNKELVLQRCSEHRARNPEYLKAWRKRNPERNALHHRRHRQKRRACEADAPFDPAVDLIEVYNRDEGVCGICGDQVHPSEATVDHVIPVMKGGGHTWGNVQLAHMKCNAWKGDRV